MQFIQGAIMKNLTFRVVYTENDATSNLEICALACKGYKDEGGEHKTVLLGDRWCVYPGNEKTPDYHMSYHNASRNAGKATAEQATSEKVINIELEHACEDVTEILLLAYVSKRNKKAGNIYDAYSDGSITLSDTNADDETIADISLSNGRLANEVTIHIGTLFRKPQSVLAEASASDKIYNNKNEVKNENELNPTNIEVSAKANSDKTFTATVVQSNTYPWSNNIKALNNILDIPEKSNQSEATNSAPSAEWGLAIFRRGSSTISIPEVIKSLGAEVEYI